MSASHNHNHKHDQTYETFREVLALSVRSLKTTVGAPRAKTTLETKIERGDKIPLHKYLYYYDNASNVRILRSDHVILSTSRFVFYRKTTTHKSSCSRVTDDTYIAFVCVECPHKNIRIHRYNRQGKTTR